MKKVGRPKLTEENQRLVLQIRMKKAEMQAFAKEMIGRGKSNRSEFARDLILSGIRKEIPLETLPQVSK